MFHEDPDHYPFWIERADSLEPMKIGLGEGFLETLEDELVGLDWLIRQGRVRRREGFALLHLAHGAVDLKAPFDMEILTVNEEVSRDPRLLRMSPYYEGWLAEIRRCG